MGTLLLVLAIVFVLVGGAALAMAARLSSAGDAPVAERQRRLRFRLATPSVLIGVVLFVVSRFV